MKGGGEQRERGIFHGVEELKPYRKDLKLLSRTLRTEMTDAEQCLWQKLRKKQLAGVQFYRQKPLLEYIVDFYCPAAKLVVEVDGSQHLAADDAEYDRIRSARLLCLGVMVVRFDNRQVLLETESVVAVIKQTIDRNVAQ